MIRRARLLSVCWILGVGALGVVSATQPWLDVALAGGPAAAVVVVGDDAVAVLTPLSLALLALGAALSIVGRVLRYVFGALSVAVAVVLGILTAHVVLARPVSAAASSVTEITGITGLDAVAALVADIGLTPWPVISLVGWVLLAGAGVFVVATARGWGGTGRRYRADDDRATESRPRDAIDSWDDLSRGRDPTA